MVSRSHRQLPILAGRRLFIVSVIILSVFGAIIAKLFYIQVIEHPYYQALANGQQQRTHDYVAQRGEIYTRDISDDGTESLYPLAANKVFYKVSIDPSKITKPINTAEALVKTLGVDYATVLSRAQKVKDSYEPIAPRATEEQMQALQTTGLPGINFEKETLRYYPDKTIGSHILGFYSSDGATGKGQYGLEGYWDSTLAGISKEAVVVRDAIGSLLPTANGATTGAVDGADLVLTIDRNIQYEICNVLQQGIEKYAADDGTVIIMESKTGRILGLCNYPSYDPNQYQDVTSVDDFNDNAVYEAYEPGSVFKPISMAIAIDQGKVTPTTVFEDKGEITIDNYKIHDFDKVAHGTKTMTEVLQDSLNLGVIFATKNVASNVYYDYVKKFGFGEKTGIELSQEVTGSLGKLNTYKDIYKATTSFGQGLTVTPLQMIAAINVLANDGVLVKPYIVDEVRYPNGEKTTTQPQAIRQVIRKDTAQTLAAMMVRVADEGYDHKAAVAGYYLAGKTGTAQIAENGVYGKKTNHTFVGFGPATDSKFTVLIKMHNVKNVGFASDSTTTLFHEIAQYLLQYYKIPPTR